MNLIKRFLEWNDGGPSYNDTYERDLELQEAIGTRPAKPPVPVPATYQLWANLDRVMRAYNDREQVLVDEIAAREAELADVRRARDATTAALVELEVTDLPDLTVTGEALHG